MTPAPRTSDTFYAYQWAILCIALLTLGGVVASTLFHEHQQIRAQESERLAIQAEIIEKNLVPQLRLANRIIEGILRNLPAWRAEQDGFKRANRELQVINDNVIGIRPILIIQADGTVIASSNQTLVGMNFSEREYFKTAAQDPDPRIFHVSSPFRTVLDTFVISLFRTIQGPHGEFDGIVIVSAIPEYFATLLDSVRYTPDMWTSIAHGDGKLFLRSPDGPGFAGMDLAKPGTYFTRHLASGRSANVFEGTSTLTGERRLLALRTIQLTTPPMDKPLVVAVTRDLLALFAPWRRSLYMQAALFGLISIFSPLVLLIVQRWRRDQSIARRKAEDTINELGFLQRGRTEALLELPRASEALDEVSFLAYPPFTHTY